MMVGSGYHFEGPDEHHGPETTTTSIMAKTSNKLLAAPAALRTGWALLLIVTMLGFMGNSAVRNLEADASVETKGTKQQQKKHLGGPSPPKDVDELKAALSALERDEESLQEQLALYVEIGGEGDNGGVAPESGSSSARNDDADDGGDARAETFVIPEELSLAHEQSFGFFDDIPNETWQLVRQRVAERRNHESADSPMLFAEEPKIWYQMNWQPDFACLLEQKVGVGMQSQSVGSSSSSSSSSAGRWVCNPHRIVPTSSERRRAGGNGCLVYSFVGSEGDGGEFVFERALLETLGGAAGAEGGGAGGAPAPCEVHVFDPRKYSGPISVPDGVHYHPWGLVGSGGGGGGSDATADATGADGGIFESFRGIVNSLGHRGHPIDVLRVDCDNGCEWSAYRDWLSGGGVDVRQILVRTHGVPENANDFFETLQSEGYVAFHKEPDTWASEGADVDYAFLKLDNSFFVAN